MSEPVTETRDTKRNQTESHPWRKDRQGTDDHNSRGIKNCSGCQGNIYKHNEPQRWNHDWK